MGHRLSKIRFTSSSEMEEEEEEEEAATPVALTTEPPKPEELSWESIPPALTPPSSNTQNHHPPEAGRSHHTPRRRWRGRPRCLQDSTGEVADPGVTSGCVCTGYRRTKDHHLGAGVVFETPADSLAYRPPDIDFTHFNADDYPVEDSEEKARQQRAKEIAEGVDLIPGLFQQDPKALSSLTAFLHRQLTLHNAMPRSESPSSGEEGTDSAHSTAITSTAHLIPIHTQVDYIHCLVPDLLAITNCSFYWGKMDRYEAERLLEKRPEGSFLLRDSAQEEYLFSVSFRRYGRSLHARIEQWNHRFSFDSHDPGVFASRTVCGLIEHYKDPSCCMFFEPMLTVPLHRNFAFSLQHLCRAAICSRTKYDGITRLLLPKSLKAYLREYHYRQRVRVRWVDSDN